VGHFIFVVLHILAFLCGFFGLFITIPLHLIYAVMLTQANNSRTNVVKKSEPQNMGRLIGLCIRVLMIFIVGIVVFVLFLGLYYRINGRAPWH
jgi:hypothetical protein